MSKPSNKDKIGQAVPGLRPCKRYITTHTPTGQSIYAPSPSQVFHIRAPFGGMARSYAVASVPANLANEADVQAYTAPTGSASFRGKDIVPTTPTGSNLVVVDLEPGGLTAMHRTVSVDYSICTVGVIECELDSGEVVRLYPGDHIVQRGTMHRWFNPSKTEPARFVACAVPCVPFDIAGKMLKEEHQAMPKRNEKARL